MLRISCAILLASLIAAPAPLDAVSVPDSTITLAKSGTCPGGTGFLVNGATPNGLVALVHGPAGTTVRSANPCRGLAIPVRNAQLLTLLNADASGAGFFITSVPPAACGRHVAAVDFATCTASAAVIL